MPTILPHDARASNRLAVFDYLRAAGPASRADAAKSIGLSAPTVGKIAEQLLADGLLEEEDSPPPAVDTPDHFAPRDRTGRPSRPLRLNRTRESILALQIGVHNTRLSALPIAGPQKDPATNEPTSERSWPITFKTPASREAFIRDLASAVRSLHNPDTAAIAISVPGALDESTGLTLLSPNIPWLHNVNLGTLVHEALPAARATPLCFVQEIRALALGQLWAQPVIKDFLLVDFGAGVGGALAANSHLYVSPLPLSGEIGHSRIPGNRRPCGCGNTGCLETLLSRRGLLASFAKTHHSAKKSWPTLVHHLEHNPLEKWLTPTLDAAGAIIATALNLVGIRDVVLTGFLAELPPPITDRITTAIRDASMWARFGEVRITLAPRRRALGLVAAAIDRILLPSPKIER